MSSPRPVLIGLASPAHPQAFYEKLFNDYKSIAESLGFQVHGIITSREELSVIRDVVKDNPVALVFLTGGTSRLARLLVESLPGKTPVMLVAHGAHNSLASALSAKNNLQLEQYNVSLVYTSHPKDSERYLRILTGISRIKSSRIVVVGEESADKQLFEKLLGVEAIFVPVEEVTRELEIASKESLEDAYKKLASMLGLSGVEKETMLGVLRLYVALKSLLEKYSASAAAIDCFDFIKKNKFTPCIALSMLNTESIPAGCEADLRALALLMISHIVFSTPGWIANPVSYEDNKIFLAHCTVAAKLVKQAMLVPHFETGLPLSVTGSFQDNVFTLTAISYDYRVLAVARAKMQCSGFFYPYACRTQAILEVEEKTPGFFVDKAVSNHHVLIPGDRVAEIKTIAELLGLRTLYY